MVNVVTCYDDNDSALGQYFEEVHEDLIESLRVSKSLVIKSIDGLNLTEKNVISTIDTLNGVSYVFVALSHGDECYLASSNDEDYVDCSNVNHFSNSLFFTTSCLTAVKLGPNLIKKGSHCYLGCNTETSVSFEDHWDKYVECENFFLKKFLLTNCTIEEAFKEMIGCYNRVIDELINLNEIFVAMELIGNRDSFVILGDTSLTKTDLE